MIFLRKTSHNDNGDIMVTYLILFFSKLLENTISTLRIIIINRGQKTFGAILNFVIAIIWSISTSIIVTNFKDLFSILSFALGCALGSYLGSFMEEKINCSLIKK